MADPISKTIPLGNDGVDLLRSGANSNNFATGTKELHPVDRIQRGETFSSWLSFFKKRFLDSQ